MRSQGTKSASQPHSRHQSRVECRRRIINNWSVSIVISVLFRVLKTFPLHCPVGNNVCQANAFRIALQILPESLSRFAE
jgi:hypothetical protein